MSSEEDESWTVRARLLDTLKKRALPGINSTLGDDKYVLQRDGAPCHTAKIFQKWKVMSEGNIIKPRRGFGCSVQAYVDADGD